MPPLPADSIHARACKLKCEKILTRPSPGFDTVVAAFVQAPIRRYILQGWSVVFSAYRSSYDFVFDMKRPPTFLR